MGRPGVAAKGRPGTPKGQRGPPRGAQGSAARGRRQGEPQRGPPHGWQQGPPKPHAHFFCSFKDQRRGSGTAFIKTLAFQLAPSVPVLQQRLLNSLLENRNESRLDDVRPTCVF